MNPDEHRAEAERILQAIRDHVDPVTKIYPDQRDFDANIRLAHVHALLAQSESAQRFSIRMGLSMEQAQRLIEIERVGKP